MKLLNILKEIIAIPKDFNYQKVIDLWQKRWKQFQNGEIGPFLSIFDKYGMDDYMESYEDMIRAKKDNLPLLWKLYQELLNLK